MVDSNSVHNDQKQSGFPVEGNSYKRNIGQDRKYHQENVLDVVEETPEFRE
jgi:hypothetical protein